MSTKNPKPEAGKPFGRIYQMALIFIILAFLFFRSFLPQYVHFNNDGPLGVQHTAWQKLPEGFTGMWEDLNDVGYSAGAFSPSITTFIKCFFSPLFVAKFYAMSGLLILGLGGWTFFRCLKLTPMAATLGAVAIMMTGTFFGGACWGVAALEIAMGFNFLALALIIANTAQTPWYTYAIRLALAGLCVGMNVIESADIGAMCSVLIAIFLVYRTAVEGTGSVIVRIIRGCVYAGVIAAFAGLIAVQAVVSLISVNITGVAGTAQDANTKQAQWDKATQFSLAKKETLGFIVPGLFGYKMDTPDGINPLFKDLYKSGNYWGSAGRDPEIDRYLDTGGTNPPPGLMRFGYGGNYAGILVVLIAIWTFAQTLRRQNSPFSNQQKWIIWFWAFIMICSLPLAWGRFAPMFYSIPYNVIPYFSTIRNPAKFIIFFCWSVAVLFAYGVNLLNRRYLDSAGPKPSGMVVQLHSWWSKATGFDRKWVWGCVVTVAASIVGWLIFNSKLAAFIDYLQVVGFPNDNPAAEMSATSIAGFAVHTVAWYVGLLAVGTFLVILTMAGYFSGPRARLGMILLSAFVIFDLGRADIPWVVHWDYKKKYEVGYLNPVEDFLRQNPYEHRVSTIPFEPQQQLPGYDYLFGGNGMYRIEWTQHHFLYYEIQSLDLIMMPRMPEDMMAYHEALAPRSEAEYPVIARHWELTNTRYLLGAAGYANVLNQVLDPGKNRFRIAMRFSLVPKPGIDTPQGLTDLTAVTNSDGQLALFEFTGALPRVSLYGNWQVNTNDPEVLKTLADPTFDPHQTVLVSTPQAGLPTTSNNANAGTVDFTSYSPKHLTFDANATEPSVMLLNDRYDSNWTVTVDGKPAPLLRCNYEMRGVYLQPGKHTVAFDFSLATKTLYVTVAGILLGIVLSIALWFCTRKSQVPTT